MKYVRCASTYSDKSKAEITLKYGQALMETRYTQQHNVYEVQIETFEYLRPYHQIIVGWIQFLAGPAGLVAEGMRYRGHFLHLVEYVPVFLEMHSFNNVLSWYIHANTPPPKLSPSKECTSPHSARQVENDNIN